MRALAIILWLVVNAYGAVVAFRLLRRAQDDHAVARAWGVSDVRMTLSASILRSAWAKFLTTVGFLVAGVVVVGREVVGHTGTTTIVPWILVASVAGLTVDAQMQLLMLRSFRRGGDQGERDPRKRERKTDRRKS